MKLLCNCYYKFVNFLHRLLLFPCICGEEETNYKPWVVLVSNLFAHIFFI